MNLCPSEHSSLILDQLLCVLSRYIIFKPIFNKKKFYSCVLSYLIPCAMHLVQFNKIFCLRVSFFPYFKK